VAHGDINRGRHYRNSRRAREQREELIELLGGKCAECDDEDDLEIHHKDGRDWEPRGMSSHARVARYWREYRAGIRLGVLCAKCNGWDGQRRMRPRERERWAREVEARKKARKGGRGGPAES
jgi:hypothetical protein